jgi:hypothetical protein
MRPPCLIHPDRPADVLVKGAFLCARCALLRMGEIPPSMKPVPPPPDRRKALAGFTS